MVCYFKINANHVIIHMYDPRFKIRWQQKKKQRPSGFYLKIQSKPTGYKKTRTDLFRRFFNPMYDTLLVFLFVLHLV
jgi:hypothetical protein